MKFIGQKGQDKWVIDDIFNFKKNGYFVDLAASDGLTGNNTYLLEKHFSWKGICIEPNPKYHLKLHQRRKCHLSHYPIDTYNDSEIIFRIDNGQLGGIVDNDTDNNYKIRGKEIQNGELIKLKTKTLEYILDSFKAPKVIDYLSLDIEGAETRALKKFPFHKYIFLALTIERPTIEIDNLLTSNGYVFVMKSKKCNNFDSFWVHKTIPNFDNIKREVYSPTPKKKT